MRFHVIVYISKYRQFICTLINILKICLAFFIVFLSIYASEDKQKDLLSPLPGFSRLDSSVWQFSSFTCSIVSNKFEKFIRNILILIESNSLILALVIYFYGKIWHHWLTHIIINTTTTKYPSTPTPHSTHDIYITLTHTTNSRAYQNESHNQQQQQQ